MVVRIRFIWQWNSGFGNDIIYLKSQFSCKCIIMHLALLVWFGQHNPHNMGAHYNIFIDYWFHYWCHHQRTRNCWLCYDKNENISHYDLRVHHKKICQATSKIYDTTDFLNQIIFKAYFHSVYTYGTYLLLFKRNHMLQQDIQPVQISKDVLLWLWNECILIHTYLTVIVI